MEIFKTIKEYREFYKSKKLIAKKIGFVPTMGALHKGHFSLMEKARKENDIVVLSVFVNPIQFGVNEDFSKYPRIFDADVRLAKEAGVDVIFFPNVDEMYAEEQDVFVEVGKVSIGLCGDKRPGHFSGVATVVAKLLNIITPDALYLGQKDYQQFLVIKRMIEQLNFDVKPVMCPIIREIDGLAMSSRNKYLNEEERKQSLCLYRALNRADVLFKNECVFDVECLKLEMFNIINQANFSKVDYIFIGRADNLQELQNLQNCEGNVLIALAVFIGKTRLIDNILI